MHPPPRDAAAYIYTSRNGRETRRPFLHEQMQFQVRAPDMPRYERVTFIRIACISGRAGIFRDYIIRECE